MGYLVIRAEEIRRIFLDEIAIVIIENPAVSITGVLLQTLSEKKIKVIFCDNKRSPYGELIPYYGSYDNSRKLKLQIGWSSGIKQLVWQKIIQEKIQNQALHLTDCDCQNEALLLESYLPQVDLNDVTNREGHAAKVYFNAIFGKTFARSDDENTLNAVLNYGYSILLAAFNRTICANGYFTQIGIHHDNIYNPYNLSSDLMEPFRVLIDRAVIEYEIKELSKDSKLILLDVLNKKIRIRDSTQTVLNAIDIYSKSIFSALNDGETETILFYHL